MAQIPTFDEVVRLAQRYGVGVYPETKHPTYFDSIGLSLEEPMLDVLARHGWRGKNDPVFLTGLRLIRLVNGSGAPYDHVVAGDGFTYDQMVTPQARRQSWDGPRGHHRPGARGASSNLTIIFI